MESGTVHHSRISSSKSLRSTNSDTIYQLQRPITSFNHTNDTERPVIHERSKTFLTGFRYKRTDIQDITNHDFNDSSSSEEEEEVSIPVSSAKFTRSLSQDRDRSAPSRSSTPDYETDLEMDIVDEPNIQDLRGAELYVRLCKDYGVVPLSCIISNINKTHFNMAHHGIGELGVKALAPPIGMSGYAKSLNLTNNMIGPLGCPFIAHIIQANEFITELGLSYNKLSGEGLAVLAPIIRNSSTLMIVDISNNEFEDKEASLIADIIENNISLRMLNLSRNLFSIDAGKIFGAAIANNDTLESLDLSWNAIRLEGAQAFAKGIAANLGLKTLNLSMNGFSADGTRSIGIALTLNKYLEHLDLSYNRVSNNAAVDFARYFKINSTLKIVKLFGNPIMFDGAQEILKTIAENERSSVHLLDLSGLQVHQEFVDLMTSMNAERPFQAKYGIVSHGKNLEATINRFADKNPLEILLIFMGAQNLRLVDLFRSFDKDQSGGLTRDEFIVGLQEIKTPLSRSQLDELLDMLDKDGDGEIDLKEILNINREFRDIKMKANRFVQEEKLQKKLEKEGKKETELGTFTKEAMAMKQKNQNVAEVALNAASIDAAMQKQESSNTDTAAEGSADAGEGQKNLDEQPDSKFKVTSEEAANLNALVTTIKTKTAVNMWKKKALV